VKEHDLKKRTKQFARDVLRIVDQLPRSVKGRVFCDQMIRAATSVGANYRAACRARSLAEFIAKLGIVIEEADEVAYWLELAMDDELLERDMAEPVWDEANQLVAIMTQSRKTAERRSRNPKSGDVQ
jgi:four helix bundle protein